MAAIQHGGPGEIPAVPVVVPADAWENTIRAYGVVNACEWFGHHADSEFTAETIRILRERSDEAERAAA